MPYTNVHDPNSSKKIFERHTNQVETFIPNSPLGGAASIRYPTYMKMSLMVEILSHKSRSCHATEQILTETDGARNILISTTVGVPPIQLNE
jgi:hypothetical protein